MPLYKRILVVALACSIFLSGCASAEIKTQAPVPVNTPEVKKSVYAGPDAYVVRAKRLTRLEKLRKEAVKRNNKDTVCVIAGTTAALAAYIVSDHYFGSETNNNNPLATMAITVAAAYAVSALTGLVFDWIAGK